MFITGISYGTLFGGRWTGALSFNVDFNGSAAVGGELSEAIIKIRTAPQGKLKFICLTGTYTQANELDIYTFVKALRDSGYIVMAISDGQHHHSWFTLLNYLVVEIGDELWPGFACNELRYKFSATSSGEEPIAPAEIGARYVIPQNGVAQQRIFDFVHKAKNQWGIISRTKYFVEV